MKYNREIELYCGQESPTQTTVHSNEILIKSWVVLDNISYAKKNDKPLIYVQCGRANLDQNLSSQTDGSFSILDFNNPYKDLSLIDFNISHNQVLIDNESNVYRNWYFVTARLKYIGSQYPAKYSIRIVASYESLYSQSCTGSLTFDSDPSPVFMGPEQNLTSVIYDDQLLLSYWLINRTENLIKFFPTVESSFQVQPSVLTNEYGISSLELANKWPGYANSSSLRGQLFCKFSKSPGDISITTHVKNDTIDQKINFGCTSLVFKDSAYSVDNVYFLHDDLIIEGTCFDVRPCSYQFILETSKGVFSVDDRLECQNSKLEWFSRTDDDIMFGSKSSRLNNRFRFSINKSAISDFPGSINFSIYSDFGKLKHDGINDKILSSLVNELLSIQYSRKNTRLKKLYRYFSKRNYLPVKRHGVCKSLPANFSEKTTNILPVFHNLSDTEGAPRVLHSILEFICDKNSDVLALRPGNLKKSILDNQFNLTILSGFNLSSLSCNDYFRYFNEILQFLLKIKPNKILLNSIDSFIVADVAWRLGIPYYWIIHESITPLKSYSSLDISIRSRYLRTLVNASNLVFVSSETSKLYQDFVDTNKISLINNGINDKQFVELLSKVNKDEVLTKIQTDYAFSINSNDLIFLSVGTTTERKGQDRSIRELGIFKKSNPNLNWKFIIVGGREIPYLNLLKGLIIQYNLQENILIIPETSDVHQYYGISDYFILNSREESSPLVILEAMASKLPIISTDIFGLKEILNDKVNSVIFDGEIEGDLSKKLSSIIGDFEQKDKIILNAYNDVVNKYSIRKTIDSYLNLLSLN